MNSLIMRSASSSYDMCEYCDDEIDSKLLVKLETRDEVKRKQFRIFGIINFIDYSQFKIHIDFVGCYLIFSISRDQWGRNDLQERG